MALLLVFGLLSLLLASPIQAATELLPERFVLAEAITAPQELPRRTSEVALQVRLLLHALQRQAAVMAERRERTMHMEREDLVALSSLCYQVHFLRMQQAKGTIGYRIMLTKRAESTRIEQQCMVNTELLLASRSFLQELERCLQLMDEHWPRMRLYTDAKLPKASAAIKQPDSPWTEQTWATMTAQLNALLTVQKALSPTEDGWFTSKDFLAPLEEAVTVAPKNAVLLVLLGEAQLLTGLPQLSQETESQAIMLAPSLYRARYIRALAHWRLQQLALAENDLSVAIEALAKDKSRQDAMIYLRARGAVRMFLERFDGMCQDFNQACSLGDCDGLRHARSNGHCLPEH